MDLNCIGTHFPSKIFLKSGEIRFSQSTIYCCSGGCSYSTWPDFQRVSNPYVLKAQFSHCSICWIDCRWFFFSFLCSAWLQWAQHILHTDTSCTQVMTTAVWPTCWCFCFIFPSWWMAICLWALNAKIGALWCRIEMWHRSWRAAASPSPNWSSGEASLCLLPLHFLPWEQVFTSLCLCLRPTLLLTRSTLHILLIKFSPPCWCQMKSQSEQ